MKKAHYDNTNGKILGFYDTDIHEVIPTPNIEISLEAWQNAIDNNHNKINNDGSTEQADFRTEMEKTKQELLQKINKAKLYLSETDYKMTVDYDKDTSEVKIKRQEARDFIRESEAKMQLFKEVDGGNPDGTAKDRVGLTAGTKYLSKYWNDNFFNIFNAVTNAGYTLVDDNLQQLVKVLKGKYDASYTYNTSSIATQSVNDVVLGSNGLLYEVQANAVIGDNPVGSVTGNWKAFKPEWLAREGKATTITPSANADYTLTADQNTYGRLKLVNGSWTSAHNIIVDNTERSFLVDNSAGTYTATVKTSAGTGIPVLAGTKVWLLCDGTNVIRIENWESLNPTGVSIGGGETLFPDGTIYGINANGSYIKYADGKLYMQKHLGNVTTDTAIGSIYTKGTKPVWTFPYVPLIAFQGDGSVICSTTNVTWASCNSILTTGTTSVLIDFYATANARSGLLTVEFNGRWK